MEKILTDKDYLDFYIKSNKKEIQPLYDPDLQVKINFFRALTSANTKTTHAYVKDGGKFVRPRGDLLILSKDGKQLFCSTEQKYGLKYGVPGGTPDPGVILRKQIINECKEEAETIVTDLEFSGIIYRIPYNNITRPKWHNVTLRPLNFKYDAMLVGVYVAIFGKRIDPLEGINPWDHDTASKFKFVDIDELDLRTEHKHAIKQYLKGRI